MWNSRDITGRLYTENVIQSTQEVAVTSSLFPCENSPCDSQQGMSISPLEDHQTFVSVPTSGTSVDKVTSFEEGEPVDVRVAKTDCEDEKKKEHGTAVGPGESKVTKAIKQTFPWFVKFTKIMHLSVWSKSYTSLKRMLSVYIRYASKDVTMCYSKPYSAAKFRDNIRNALTFFHFYWNDIKETIDDHTLYLDKMSEIVAMYMDMELKASKWGKDSWNKISARLLIALHVYLDSSKEHICRVLFRSKFVTKKYSEICKPIFAKFFVDSCNDRESMTDVMYVRYLLGFKLWKKSTKLGEKKKIDEMKMAEVGPQLPNMDSSLIKFDQKPPEYHKNRTWLMQLNSLDLKKDRDNFVAFKENKDTFSPPEDVTNGNTARSQVRTDYSDSFS